MWKARDPAAIDNFVIEDFVITTGGVDVVSRTKFKEWADAFMAKIDDLQFEVIETFQNEDGSRVASKMANCREEQTGYLVLRQTSNPFPSPAPQFGQCETMESSVITGLNAARLNCSNNCAIRVRIDQQRATFDFRIGSPF